MRRIIVFSLLGLTLAGGVAAADRYHGRSHENARGGVVVRDTRSQRHDHRWDERVPSQRRVVVNRRPVYVSNGYYQFHNGARYRYTRPVIHRRYFDVRVRPQIIVENYQPVAGYVWVAGQWQWNGYEWLWVSGHYAADPNYVEYQSY